METPLPPAGHDPAGCRMRPGWWDRALREGELKSRPEWAGIVEEAVAAAVPPAALRAPDSWPEAFAIPFRPFLAAARDRLIESARSSVPPGHIDLALVGEAFTATLGRRLARIAVRVMVVELDEARAAGRLVGAGGRQRFEDFLRRWSGPDELARLFTEYPVLARLLGTASLLASEAGGELLARFAADRGAVVQALLQGRDPGPIVSIEPGLGDPHRHGRSVAAVSFADGRQVIYKPRSQDAYLLFREVVGWLNQKVPGAGLLAASVVSRPGYGWMEYIASRPLPGAGAARAFYQREGILLAALYAMHAVDIHCENIIASSDQPVLIDVETLFHPTMPVPRTTIADPAAEALNASVRRSSMLPNLTVGDGGMLDRSGMGGDPGQPLPDAVLDWDPPATDTMALVHRTAAFPGARNRPRLDGRLLEPADHETAVVEGFRLGYDAIAAERHSFMRLIESGAAVESRIIVRPSSGYARLLDESTHPSLMRDVRDRDAALGVLGHASAHHPLWRALVEHELADLWAGDIPLMSGRPESRDIWTSSGHHLPRQLEGAGLRSALDKVAAMSEVDRRDQEWLISASMATRRPGSGHRGAPPPREPAAAIAAEPGRLLATACGLADQVVARAMTGGDEQARRRVNWAELQLVEDSRWMVLPMGASLADGYLGVALFLAQLAGLTGIDRYTEVARRAVSALPQLLDVLAAQPDLLSAVGCGGMDGLGGISYGLARMANLLGDAEIRAWADAAVELAAAAAGQAAEPGWAAGTAGCLGAMIAVGAELGSGPAASAAGACADRLRDLVERTDGRCVAAADAVSPSFTAGPAGIGWALSRFARAGGGASYARAGRLAVWRGGAPVISPSGPEAVGWCRGAAGLLIARTCLTQDTGLAGLRSALAALSARPVLSDLSLCHGELGIAESLIVLADAIADGDASRAYRHRAGLILGALNRDVRHCGTPGGTSTPGLLNGLAGIGYGLLRLGFADRVPSVLLLEAGPRADGDTDH